MTIFDEQRKDKKIIKHGFTPLLREHHATDEGCLEITLLSADKKEVMERILKNMDEFYYFEQHQKNPFTYEYSEDKQAYIIRPGDVSIETILDSLRYRNLIQPDADDVRSVCSPS